MIEFYRKVRPSGPGWEPIRKAAGLPVGAAAADNIPLAMLGWTAGCTAIWSALFTVGNLLYMRPIAAAILFVVFLVSASRAGERHAEGVELVGLLRLKQNLRARGRRVCLSPEP